MTPDVTAAFLQYGVLGVLAVIVGMMARTLVKREQARTDVLEDDNRRMVGAIQKFLSGVSDSTADHYGLTSVDEDGKTRAIRELEQWWETEQQRKKQIEGDR